MGDSVTVGMGPVIAFATSFPVTLCSTLSSWIGFWRFGYVFVNSIRNANPRTCSVSKQRFDHDFGIVTFLMGGRPSHPRPGRSSCFPESTLSLGMLLRFEATYTFDIDSSFQLVLLNQCDKELSFFNNLQTRVTRHSLDNFWSSRSCSNVCSWSRSKFPCNSASVRGSATSSVWMSIDSKSSFAASFPATSEPLDNSVHKSAAAPWILSWFTEIIVRRTNSIVSSLPLKWIDFSLFFASQFSSFHGAGGTKDRMTTFGKVEHFVRKSCPNLRLAYQTTNVFAWIFEHTQSLWQHSQYNLLYFLVLPR